MLGIVFIAFAACFVLERVVPGWRLPRVPTWPVRVLLINAVQIGVVLLGGLSWERWLSSWSMFHLSERVAVVTGGLIAYFIATFVFYWWTFCGAVFIKYTTARSASRSSRRSISTR